MAESPQAKAFEEAGKQFVELLKLMTRLRGPDGCPWDRKQTFASIKPYTLEETYEVLDAIDAEDWPALSEELGDFLLQAVFYAEMAREAGLFTIADSLRAINAKLIRRHPHIFGDGNAKTPDEVKLRWDEIKREEKATNGVAPNASILDGVSRSLPALMEAEKLGQKVSAVGFDWPNTTAVLDKLQEEAEELVAAQDAGADPAAMEHELGDLLFNVVNLARHLNIDPEQALHKTNARFRRRFGHIEKQLAASSESLEAASLDRMEQLWHEAKMLETKS